MLINHSCRSVATIYVPSLLHEEALDKYGTRKRQKRRFDLSFSPRTAQVAKR